jgi:hypothetical protein
MKLIIIILAGSEGIICRLNIQYSRQGKDLFGVKCNRLDCTWKLFPQSILFWDQIFLILPAQTQILYVVINEAFLSLVSENKYLGQILHLFCPTVLERCSKQLGFNG